ncbi:hypothetical protein DyAD56_19965 [Dyella sp. AD56]|uniref:hypothetical protein n=1 Tax=Dyella sp. AD56 TaxID=1528744 RepID=UPI000CABE86E|nr:hypothetical protein [Dyella sp. AD56]MDR3443783.1 hypothetical protein [Dyella sp.]PMQ03322.1 hypothetical protein DyAD56_19965 [Dyella sp. AD56]
MLRPCDAEGQLRAAINASSRASHPASLARKVGLVRAGAGERNGLLMVVNATALA